jgi:hypothetical protein
MAVIPQTPRASGGLCLPLGPLPGLCPWPTGDLKRSPDPSPTHTPLTTNSGSAPVYYQQNQIWLIVTYQQKQTNPNNLRGPSFLALCNKLIIHWHCCLLYKWNTICFVICKSCFNPRTKHHRQNMRILMMIFVVNWYLINKLIINKY